MANELLRLKGFMLARKLHNQHKQIHASKRSVKGRAKGLNATDNKGGVHIHMKSVESLKWSPHKYKSLNSTFNGITQAS